MMGDLTEHFSRVEFACKCGCGFDTVDVDTLALLEEIRAHFGKPVTITSACRCAKHNAAVGGAAKSQHVRARAADIKIAGVEPEAVALFVESIMPDRGGVGVYASFTHIDTRTDRARWGG